MALQFTRRPDRNEVLRRQGRMNGRMRNMIVKNDTNFETINTSHGTSDFREVIIAKTSSDEKYIIKLADNDFTFPNKIDMRKRCFSKLSVS